MSSSKRHRIFRWTFSDLGAEYVRRQQYFAQYSERNSRVCRLHYKEVLRNPSYAMHVESKSNFPNSVRI